MKRLAIALILILGACAAPPRGTGTNQPLPPPPPKGEPQGMMGLTSVQLQAVLGNAAFSRRENGSELWRYDAKNCHAFFFLYTEGSVLVVRHVETVPQGPGAAADPACLNALRGKPAKPVS
jgi:hypothetical protein